MMDIEQLLTLLVSLTASPASDVLEQAAQAVPVVDLMVDFLRDERCVPNVAIHRLMTLCWRLIGTREIPLLLDPTGGRLQTLSFAVLQGMSSGKQRAGFLMPLHWLSLVHTDPLMQLCGWVHLASQGADYTASRLGRFTPQRARAYEAELLVTLTPQIEAAQMPLSLNPYLQEVLQTYPKGLGSLPDDLVYPPTTPAS